MSLALSLVIWVHYNEFVFDQLSVVFNVIIHKTKPSAIGNAHDPRTAVYCIPETGYILEDRRKNENPYVLSSNSDGNSVFYAIPMNIELEIIVSLPW